MVDEQTAIYYLLGEDLDSVARSPHLDYFRANDVEVLYLVDPIDAFMIMALTEYEENRRMGLSAQERGRRLARTAPGQGNGRGGRGRGQRPERRRSPTSSLASWWAS